MTRDPASECAQPDVSTERELSDFSGVHARKFFEKQSQFGEQSDESVSRAKRALDRWSAFFAE